MPTWSNSSQYPTPAPASESPATNEARVVSFEIDDSPSTCRGRCPSSPRPPWSEAAAGSGPPSMRPAMNTSPFSKHLADVLKGLRFVSDAATKLESEWLRLGQHKIPMESAAVCRRENALSPRQVPAQPDLASSHLSQAAHLINAAAGQPDMTSKEDSFSRFKAARTESFRKKSISQIYAIRKDWRDVDIEERKMRDYETRFQHSLAEADVASTLAADAGNAAESTAQEDDTPKLARCVLHPSGLPRILWNIVCLVLLSYDILVIPLSAFPLEASTFGTILEWVCTLAWTFDIAVSIRTGFYRGDILVLEPWPIALHYARTWMTLDLVIVATEWASRLSSTFPGGGAVLRSSRAFRILRLVRLLRVAKLQSLWSIVEDQFTSSVLHLCLALIKMTIVLCVMVHAVACSWYALGEHVNDGWTTYYAANMEVEDKKDWKFWYFASCRWTLAQINGRTDSDERRTQLELVFTCAVAVCFAVIFMSLFISNVTATMMELNNLAESKTQQRRIMNDYLGRHRVSAELTGSVKNHLAHRLSRDTGDRDELEKKAMALLPQQMANDLIYEVRVSILLEHSYFRSMNTEFPRALRHVCYAATRHQWPHRDEAVFEWGDACSRMLFVDTAPLVYVSQFFKEILHEGEIQEMHNDEDEAERTSSKGSKGSKSTFKAAQPDGVLLRRSDWLSEGALWVEWINRGRLIAGADCCLLAFDAAEFARVLGNYRHAYAMAVLYARNYAKEIAAQEFPCDLPHKLLGKAK